MLCQDVSDSPSSALIPMMDDEALPFLEPSIFTCQTGLIRAATGELFTHAQLPTQFNNMAAKNSLSNGMQAKIKAFMNGSAKSSLKTSLFSNANGIRT